jgi:uncharacterized protein (TIGR03437 family)
MVLLGLSTGVGQCAAPTPTYSVSPIFPLPAGWTFAYANGINDSGQITGYGWNGTGYQAFIGTAADITLIPLPAGWTSAMPFGINNSGQIAGYVSIGSTVRAFIGTAAGITPIPLPAGWTASQANGINNSGQIVGTGVNATGTYQAFIGTAAGITPIPLPAGWTSSYASGINSSGQIVGSGSKGGRNPAFIGTAAGITPIPLPAGWTGANAYGINDSGQITGYVYNGTNAQAYIGTAAGITPIPLPAGWTSSYASGINNSGQIVGNVFNGGNFPSQAFIGTAAGIITPIPLPAGWDGTTIAYDLLGIDAGGPGQSGINNSGQIVGGASNSGSNGVIFSGGVILTPPLTISTTSLENATSGQPYSTSLAAYGGSGTGYTWTIASGLLPAGFTLTPAGVLSSTGTPPAFVQSYDFTVSVTDSAGDNGTQALTLILAPPLTISTTSLGNPTGGQPYSASLAASGGSGTGYTWSIASGLLPVGFTLTLAGVLSSTGTPPASIQSYNFTVSVTDSAGDNATQQLTLTIVPTCAALIDPPSFAQPYAVTLATGPVAAFNGRQACMSCGMSATFMPNFGYSLVDAAALCGFTGFNWQQTVDVLPLPNPLTTCNMDPGLCFYAKSNPQPLQAPFADPPSGGGYTYQTFDDAFPFYFNFVNLLKYTEPYTLTFFDTPAIPVLNTTTQADDKFSPTASAASFSTYLVGIEPVTALPSLPLFTWTWVSDFNGTAGGVSVTKNLGPVDFGSGTGGVTITSINGSPLSICDLKQNGNINVADLQLVINEALGVNPAVDDLNGDGVVTVVDVQIVTMAAVGLGCWTNGPSPASLSGLKNSARRNSGTYSRRILIPAPASINGPQAVSVAQNVTTPRPTITAVVNAASLQSGPVSPGEVVTLVGIGLGPSTSAGLTLDQTRNVATSLGGVQVSFNGKSAPLTYVSAIQINCVVPREIRGLADLHVKVSYQGQTSNVFLLASATTVPALFTADGTGMGSAAAINQDLSYNSPNNPASNGSMVVLFMTGEGLTTSSAVTGAVTSVPAALSPTTQLLLPVAVFINGAAATTILYGEAPGVVSGVMQLKVQIPLTVPSGNLPISVSVGGSSSPKGVTVSVK